MNEIVNFDGVQFKKDKLIIKEGMDFKTWEKLGHALKSMQGSIQWWLGDWLNYGEKHYGETYTQAIEITGYEYDTLAQFKSVSSRVESCSREQNLSFSHHKAVAPLEPEEQKEYLDIAEKENLSVSKLRDRIKSDYHKPQKGCKHKNMKEIQILSCPDCGYKSKNYF
jgi:hypothetical protein